ncbi:LAGLIDADG family homing endonuclease [Clostridium sporogenes]|uniref:LAGLIDADG family homing endonuclease n=1 Tax=Clostridium sporogenes TaxID=1509 RepID=UPI003F8E0223
MANEQKAYIAGIIDGESSIMLLKFHNNQFPSPYISISSTMIELLEWIKSVTKIGTIKRKKNYNTEEHTDSFTYTIKYNDAINLLVQIEPYLVIKNKQKRAKLIIEKYKSVTLQNGKYSDEMLKTKEKFYKEFINVK